MSKSKKPDISQIVKDYLCHSCGACLIACTQGSISFHETIGGYLFPRINSETCTQCGACFEVCPGHHFGRTLKELMPSAPFEGEILSCYVGRATDNDIYENSQSGGVATAMVKHLFETDQIEGAILAVLETTLPPRGGVFLALSPADLPRSQKSKYTPIPLLTGIQVLKERDARIAMVGLPCHFHGLHNLLDRCPVLDITKIFKIGLVCDRIMTSAAIDFMTGKATNQPVKGFTFRDKTRPSYPGNPVVEKEDGGRVVLSANLRMTMKDFFTPARCRLCFDKMNVFADVVLGDPHEMPEIDRLHGETLVIARTAKGVKLVEDIERKGVALLRKADPSQAMAGQGMRKKAENWAAFMGAWRETGRAIPEYPFASPYVRPGKRHRKWITHALKLDFYPSRGKVLFAAGRWLTLNEVKRYLKWPGKKARKIIKRVLP